MPERLKTAAAATYLSTPTATLAYWRSRGVGPRWYRLGKHVLYDRDDLDAYIDQQKRLAAAS